MNRVAKSTELILAILIMLSISAVTLAPTKAEAANQFGVGFVLGKPTALNAKIWFDGKHAADFGLGWFGDDSFLFYGDFLWHAKGSLGGRTRFARELAPYVGVGLLARSYHDHGWHYHDHEWHHDDDHTDVNLRVPLGIEWLPSAFPIGVFVELVPGILIVPEMDGIFQGGIGIRYYF